MTRYERDVELMHEIFECRKSARFLLRDSYDKSVKPYRDLLVKVMAKEKLMPLQAALRLAQHLPASDAVPTMLLMAAALDEIESVPEDVAAEWSKAAQRARAEAKGER